MTGTDRRPCLHIHKPELLFKVGFEIHYQSESLQRQLLTVLDRPILEGKWSPLWEEGCSSLAFLCWFQNILDQVLFAFPEALWGGGQEAVKGLSNSYFLNILVHQLVRDSRGLC